jgi:hypothetical protein
MAYYRAAVRFFAWCDQHHVGEIDDIEDELYAALVQSVSRRTYSG